MCGQNAQLLFVKPDDIYSNHRNLSCHRQLPCIFEIFEVFIYVLLEI